MLIEKIGNRGVMFTFADNITVYLIDAGKKYFLCDTHLGPYSMEYIKQYICCQGHEKEAIIFNSHADWDHIWGNCAFANAVIIGHEACRKRMQEIGPFDLARLPEYHRGQITLVLPNLTFSDKMSFEDEGVNFIHSPGHTMDSALCFDRKDSVLFVGDLVEDPIPYLDDYDLDIYLKTLEFIKSFPARIKISSHSGIVDNTLIDRNISYVKDIFAGKSIDGAKYKDYQSVHKYNLNNRLFLPFERTVREKLGERFDYGFLRSEFTHLENMSHEELKEAMAGYLDRIE